MAGIRGDLRSVKGRTEVQFDVIGSAKWEDSAPQDKPDSIVAARQASIRANQPEKIPS